MTEYSIAELEKMLRQRLHEDRFNHSLGVAAAAKNLCERYGEDPERGYTAGLLHDITKNTPYEEQLKIIENGGIILSPEEKSNKLLWHAISGSVFIRDELHFDDGEIISAVRYHTTGRSGMTVFEKIIYIADFISEERSFPGVEYMRGLAFESLEKAALYALDFCIPNLVKKRAVIHPDSVSFYNELIENNITL